MASTRVGLWRQEIRFATSVSISCLSSAERWRIRPILVSKVERDDCNCRSTARAGIRIPKNIKRAAAGAKPAAAKKAAPKKPDGNKVVAKKAAKKTARTTVQGATEAAGQ